MPDPQPAAIARHAMNSAARSLPIGVVLPHEEIPLDAIALRDYAQAMEALGVESIGVLDHVLGADTTHRPDLHGPHGLESRCHEPMVLFGFLAAVTTKVRLTTEVLVLPQRQTALVAKQAAEIDVLSGGRLRLGVGLGISDVDYGGLGADFHNRGRRIEEQVQVLRAFWTQEVVSFQGRWHHISEAGINPLPVQRPIPFWFGGGRVEASLRRIAKLADGWFPSFAPDGEGAARIEQVRGYAREVGRDPATIGIEGRVRLRAGTIDDCIRCYEAWQALGVSHVLADAREMGEHSVDGHVALVRRFLGCLPGVA